LRKKKDGETPSLLQIEDVNYPIGRSDGEFEPLFALAISAKRYALFNLVPFEELFGRKPQTGEPELYPLLRKVSAHGTGQLTEPIDYKQGMAKPLNEKGKRRGSDGKLSGEPLSNRPSADQLLADVAFSGPIETISQTWKNAPSSTSTTGADLLIRAFRLLPRSRASA
jgi:hypothetical protein